MQGTTAVLLLCAIAIIDAQYMNPYQTIGMNPLYTGVNTGVAQNPIWRPQGYLQTSQMNSMTYPTWRTHPLFRVAAVNTDKNIGRNLPQDVMNVPKVPATQEVLSHMALVNQNVKPMYDTIADMLFEPQKARQAILTPVYLQGINNMRANMMDDCGPQETPKWDRGYSDWVY